jgi:hypothetical protein
MMSLAREKTKPSRHDAEVATSVDCFVGAGTLLAKSL